MVDRGAARGPGVPPHHRPKSVSTWPSVRHPRTIGEWRGTLHFGDYRDDLSIMQSDNEFTPQAVLVQLKRVLESSSFVEATRSGRLLRYCVERVVGGRT